MTPSFRGKNAVANGFTLLEILVAVAILGLAYVVVLQNFSQSFHNLEKVENAWARDFATILGRERDLMVIPTKKNDAAPLEGDIYLKGLAFQLVVVQDSGLTTVLLEKKP